MYDIVGKTILSVAITDIFPNEYNTRLNVSEEYLKGLSLSIKSNGFLQPLVLKKTDNKYEIILGFRRFCAAKILNLKTLPAIVINETEKFNFLENSLIDKLTIKELSPIEEANTLKELMNQCGKKAEDINMYIGKSDNYVNNKMNLLNLSDSCQNALMNNFISEGHAKVLLKVKEIDVQNRLLDKIIKERLSVKDTDDYVISNKLDFSLNKNNNIGSYLGNQDVINLKELDNESMNLVNIPDSKKEKNKEVSKMDMNSLNQASQQNMGMNGAIQGNQNNFFPSVDIPESNNIINSNNEMPMNVNSQFSNPFVDNNQFNNSTISQTTNDIQSNSINPSFSTPIPNVSNDFRVEAPVSLFENTAVNNVNSSYESQINSSSQTINTDNALICMRGIVQILQNMGYKAVSRENDVNGKLEFVIEIQK